MKGGSTIRLRQGGGAISNTLNFLGQINCRIWEKVWPKMVNKINAIEYSGGTGLHHRYTRAAAWIMCINAGNRTDDLVFKRDRIKAARNAALIL
jgi:hypothetical protein